MSMDPFASVAGEPEVDAALRRTLDLKRRRTFVLFRPFLGKYAGLDVAAVLWLIDLIRRLIEMYRTRGSLPAVGNYDPDAMQAVGEVMRGQL